VDTINVGITAAEKFITPITLAGSPMNELMFSISGRQFHIDASLYGFVSIPFWRSKEEKRPGCTKPCRDALFKN